MTCSTCSRQRTSWEMSPHWGLASQIISVIPAIFADVEEADVHNLEDIEWGDVDFFTHVPERLVIHSRTPLSRTLKGIEK